MAVLGENLTENNDKMADFGGNTKIFFTFVCLKIWHGWTREILKNRFFMLTTTPTLSGWRCNCMIFSEKTILYIANTCNTWAGTAGRNRWKTSSVCP
jgi:hypothetical protein